MQLWHQACASAAAAWVSTSVCNALQFAPGCRVCGQLCRLMGFRASEVTASEHNCTGPAPAIVASRVAEQAGVGIFQPLRTHLAHVFPARQLCQRMLAGRNIGLVLRGQCSRWSLATYLCSLTDAPVHASQVQVWQPAMQQLTWTPCCCNWLSLHAACSCRTASMQLLPTSQSCGPQARPHRLLF